MNNLPYINIHTHRDFPDFENTIRIQNIFPEEDLPSGLFSVGIHPWNANRTSNETWKIFNRKASHPRCIAIGESGLDKQNSYKSFWNEQIIVFQKQIDWANQLKKPMIIHCVKCYDILLHFREKGRTPWIIHGFSKGPELARQIIKFKQTYLSFGHLLLNPESKASKTIQNVPLDKIFFETDDKTIRIQEIYRKATQILNLEEEILKQQILTNFQKVFGDIIRPYMP